MIRVHLADRGTTTFSGSFQSAYQAAQRVQDMFAHEVRDAYEITEQQASLLEGLS